MSTTIGLRPKGPIPQIKLFGDWKKTAVMMAGLEAAVTTGYTLGQISASKKIIRILRSNIRNNGGKTYWPELSDSYAEYKESYGYDSGNLLVMTGLYYRSIKHWNIRNTHYVGLKGKTRNYFTGGNITLQEVAAILEHGSAVAGIPARPLWAPSLKEFGGAKRLRSSILWHIHNQIRTKLHTKAHITF